MLVGGGTTVLLGVLQGREMLALPLGLDANVFGLTAAAVVFSVVAWGPNPGWKA
jgi:hypothetical protein